MFTFFLVLHILVCIGLIISILMQSAKGEGLAGAFGGGSISSAVFGGRGAATFLARATTVLAVAFGLTCVSLTLTAPRAGTSGTSAVAKEAAKGGIPAPQPPPPTQVPVTQQPAQPAGQQQPDVNQPPAPKKK